MLILQPPDENATSEDHVRYSDWTCEQFIYDGFLAKIQKTPAPWAPILPDVYTVAQCLHAINVLAIAYKNPRRHSVLIK